MATCLCRVRMCVRYLFIYLFIAWVNRKIRVSSQPVDVSFCRLVSLSLPMMIYWPCSHRWHPDQNTIATAEKTFHTFRWLLLWHKNTDSCIIVDFFLWLANRWEWVHNLVDIYKFFLYRKRAMPNRKASSGHDPHFSVRTRPIGEPSAIMMREIFNRPHTMMSSGWFFVCGRRLRLRANKIVKANVRWKPGQKLPILFFGKEFLDLLSIYTRSVVWSSYSLLFRRIKRFSHHHGPESPFNTKCNRRSACNHCIFMCCRSVCGFCLFDVEPIIVQVTKKVPNVHFVVVWLGNSCVSILFSMELDVITILIVSLSLWV